MYTIYTKKDRHILDLDKVSLAFEARTKKERHEKPMVKSLEGKIVLKLIQVGRVITRHPFENKYAPNKFQIREDLFETDFFITSHKFRGRRFPCLF